MFIARYFVIGVLLSPLAGPAGAADCVLCVDNFKKCQADKSRTDCVAKRNECLLACQSAAPTKPPAPSTDPICATATVKTFSSPPPAYECVVVDNNCDFSVRFTYILSGSTGAGDCVRPHRSGVRTLNCSGDKSISTLRVSSDYKQCQ
jgi:hypothetical protein